MEGQMDIELVLYSRYQRNSSNQIFKGSKSKMKETTEVAVVQMDFYSLVRGRLEAASSVQKPCQGTRSTYSIN